MDARAEAGERSPLTLLLGVVVAVGLVRVVWRLFGLIALLGVVIGSVAAFAIGILLLRVALLP